jgi:hypothetical protein
MFLSALTPDQFLKILSAIMLEKSLIFVSDNLPLLSSAVLGMQCFILPFKWSYVQIPILPKSLIDMVEAPMPFLVGLLRSHLSSVPLIQEGSARSPSFPGDYSEQERLVVYINDSRKEVKIDDHTVQLVVPSFKNLVEKLTMPFSVLNSSKQYIYTPNDRQKQALHEISDIMLATFNENICNNLPADVLKAQRKV